MKDPKSRRHRIREVIAEIRQVVFVHWDPIGVRQFGGLEDEYDAYICKIYQLLVTGASHEQLAEYLIHTESETIRVSVEQHQRDEVIKLLRNIDLKIE